MILKRYDANCPVDGVQTSFANAGCSGQLMSVNQFYSWVALVFLTSGSEEEAEQGLGQLLLANGIEFGTGKDDKAHRERLDRERRLMAENAKKARAAAGERVIFEVVKGPVAPPRMQAIAPPKSRRDMQSDLDKKARLTKERGMMEEMRKQKEQADGGIDAVKKALENQKTETLKAFQQMQQAEAEKKDAVRKLKEAEDRLQAYTCSTDGELRVLRWLVQRIAKEQKTYIATAPQQVVDTAKGIYVAGAEAAAADPAGTLAALGLQMPANAPRGGVLSPRSSALVAQGGGSRSMTPSKRDRIQRERALMQEFASKTKSEDPLSRSLGQMADTIIKSQAAMPLTHSIAMADEKELLDWNFWAKEKDMQEALATPAGQLAVKHQRKQKPLTQLEQRIKDEEAAVRNARPENQAMSQLRGYAQQVSGLLEGVLAVSKWSPSPSPAAASSPPLLQTAPTPHTPLPPPSRPPAWLPSCPLSTHRTPCHRALLPTRPSK